MRRHAPLERRHVSRPRTLTAVTLVTLVASAWLAGAAGPADPDVGAWATYRWTSSLAQDVPVLVRQEGPGGEVTWSVTRESAAPPPLFVTYSIVRGTTATYTLQIVTRTEIDSQPLSITQVTVDRASGDARRSVIRYPKGVIATPESGLRPFSRAAVEGSEEAITVPAGRFSAVRTPYGDGTVWLSGEVPALELVKAVFPTGTLELLRSGRSGATDLFRS